LQYSFPAATLEMGEDCILPPESSMPRSDQENWKPMDVARLLALVETERRYYQELFSALPSPAAVLDRNLALAAVNREFRRRFALDASELGKLRLPDLLPSEVLDEAAARVLSGETAREEVLVEIGLHEPRRYRIGVQRVFGWQDSAEEELLLTVEELPAAPPPLVLPAPLVAWTLDRAGGAFVQVSHDAGERLGVPAEAWQSVANWAETRVHPEDRAAYLRFHEETLPRACAGELEYRIFDAAAECRTVRELVTRDADGRCHGVSMEARHAGREQRREREQAKREALERLSGRLAHVANNLLMIIGGYAEELTQSFEEEDPRRGDLEEITRAAARLAGLTTQLSVFARPPQVEREEFRWSHWLASAGAPGGESGDWILEGHGALLAEAAREARRVLAGHGRPETDFRIDLLETETPGVVEIRMELPGLPRDAVETLLEPFGGPREGTDPPLGLAGIAGQLEKAGMQAGVDPEGPALCVRTRGRRAEAPAAVEAPPPPLASILLVEDEAGIRALVEKTLTRAGYEVLSAPGADAAFALCEQREGPVDLLITDIMMPGAGGGEVAQRLGASHPDLRVLFISGHHDDALLAQQEAVGRAPGTSLLLGKPFSLGELLRSVEMLLGRARGASAGQS
jgi:CheY-like chemotaxis protein